MLINDHFQNFKQYNIPRAQLVIADIPYNIGINAYGSNPSWYIDGDNKNGESKLAGKSFFDTDNDFRISEFLSFCTKLLVLTILLALENTVGIDRRRPTVV